MRIRGVCTYHNKPLELEGAILFPTSSDKPAQDENGWLDLDSSEMYCPDFDADSQEAADECIQSWKWEIQQ